MPTPTKKTPQVVVMIVTWNKKNYVLDLLASLNNLTYPRECLDIVVVDNASSDGTIEALESQHPDVILLKNTENVGGTGGFNTAMAWGAAQPEDRYDYWWLLDNDLVVHKNALQALIDILEQHDDIAVAGSTMMQLDFPWRINEMGCFFKRDAGNLILNRHMEEIPALRARHVEDLIVDEDLNLPDLIRHCQPYMDVEYVAAASLVIRSQVARQTGLWRDYFIHYDDVEWCLRISDAGYRIVVSAQSLIWHLSAAAKIPTWILYYDHRNMLDSMEQHGGDPATIQAAIKRIMRWGLNYALYGKADLSRLHREAVDDFLAGRLGKKDITLDYPYQAGNQSESVFMDPTIKRILVSSEVNLQATNLQYSLIQAMRQRPDLQVDFMRRPDGLEIYQVPRQNFISIPSKRLKRLIYYWRQQKYYDLVIQSDYHTLTGLSWLGSDLLFVNDDGFSRRPPPQFKTVLDALKDYLSCGSKRRYPGKKS